MTNIDLAKQCGATEGWLAGTPAHHDNKTYLFTSGELDAYTAAIRQQLIDEIKLGEKGYFYYCDVDAVWRAVGAEFKNDADITTLYSLEGIDKCSG